MKPNVQMVVVENFGSCNINCRYCFPEHMWRRSGLKGRMAEPIYRDALTHAFSSSDLPRIHVRFAGGEPLLAGLSWFQMAISTGRSIANEFQKEVVFSLQTNGVAMTDELAEFLAENEVEVGISIDGPPEINDQIRGNTAETLRGLDIICSKFKRPPGVIVTVTKCNYNRMAEIVDYLDSLGIQHFRANQMGATAEWNLHHAPTGSEWFIARRDIIVEVSKRNGRIIEFNTAQSVRKFVSTLQEERSPFRAGLGCCDMRCPAGRELVYFNQQGVAYPCPRSNVSAGTEIGHISNSNFQEKWSELVGALDQSMSTPAECNSCIANIVCDFGCHAFNSSSKTFFKSNCNATKEYFVWMLSNLDVVATVHHLLEWRESVDADSERKKGLDFFPIEVHATEQRLSSLLNSRIRRASQVAIRELARRFDEIDGKADQPSSIVPRQGGKYGVWKLEPRA